jgi:AAA+ superfamily predicted ATPase
MQQDDLTSEYLSKSYANATLAEHARFGREESGLSKSEVLVKAFLGVDFDDMTLHVQSVRRHDVPCWHHALNARFSDWQLIKERRGMSRYRLECPARERFEVRPGVFEEYLVEGLRFYETSNGQRRVLRVECEREDDYVFGVFAPQSESDQVAAEMQQLDEWIEENHYLKGQGLRDNGTLLPSDRPMTWDDVALKEDVQSLIQRNTVELLDHHEHYQRNGLPLKRGILLHGPPGTGKTLVGKVLAAISDVTLVYVTAASAERLETLRKCFALARRLKPSILFFEDLDLFAYERRSSGIAGSLGEILAQMDGMEENDGLICIATTNDLEAIEPALKDRPSRFDVVLEIGLPDEVARRRIFKMNLKGEVDDERLLTEVTAATDGLSGAQVREVAYAASQEAILRGALDASGMARPSRDDVRSVLERMLKHNKSRVGFCMKPHLSETHEGAA